MTIKRIAIFDFDGTLFASPEKPDWWPYQGFWGRLETLSPPYIPENPGPEWFSSAVVGEAQQAISDPDTYTCLLTGRIPKFGTRIKAILDGAGLKFDDYFFTSGSATLDFKLSIIENLIQRFPDARVEMWDDRHEHAGNFETKIKELGVVGTVHRVNKVTHEFIGPSVLAAKLARIASAISDIRIANKMSFEDVSEYLKKWLDEKGKDYKNVQPGDKKATVAYDVMTYLFENKLKSSEMTLNGYLKEVVSKMKPWIKSNETLRSDQKQYKEEMTNKLWEYGVPRGVYLEVFHNNPLLFAELEEENIKHIRRASRVASVMNRLGFIDSEIHSFMTRYTSKPISSIS